MGSIKRRSGGRRRTGSRERAKQDRRAILIFVLGGLAVAMLALAILLNPPNLADPRTGCIGGNNIPKAHTIVVVDQTDRLSSEQVEYVRRLVLLEYKRLELGELFTVVGLNPDSAATETAKRSIINFSRCRIELGDEADEFFQNPALVNQAFQALVGSTLDQAFAAMATMPEAKTSPILELIDKLADRVTFASPKINRRLVIVSDMAQFSDAVTHYPPVNLVFSMPKTDSLRSSRNLEDVVVRIHYLKRSSLQSTQNADHLKYWESYFRNSDVTDVRIGWGISDDADDLAPLSVAERTLQPEFKPAP